ncbi:MAG: hypothetical protein HC933_00050 [Pleurocapsa sp. SU_196_0]|nr:hypothetical protein [Pleurocapsa sp. SU_196_0]
MMIFEILTRTEVEETQQAVVLKAPFYREWFSLLVTHPVIMGIGGYFLVRVFDGVTKSGLRGNRSLFSLDWPIVLWLFAMLLLWLWTGFQWLKMVFGMETVRFTGQSVIITKQVLLYSSQKTYVGVNVGYVRQLDPTPFWKRSYTEQRSWGNYIDGEFRMHRLAFDSNNKTIQFASGVSSEQANNALERIEAKFPHYSY